MITKIWEAATQNLSKTITIIASMGVIMTASVKYYDMYSSVESLPKFKKEIRSELKEIKAESKKERERVNIAFNVLRAELDHDSIWKVQHGGEESVTTVSFLEFAIVSAVGLLAGGTAAEALKRKKKDE